MLCVNGRKGSGKSSGWPSRVSAAHPLGFPNHPWARPTYMSPGKNNDSSTVFGGTLWNVLFLMAWSSGEGHSFSFQEGAL